MNLAGFAWGHAEPMYYLLRLPVFDISDSLNYIQVILNAYALFLVTRVRSRTASITPKLPSNGVAINGSVPRDASTGSDPSAIITSFAMKDLSSKEMSKPSRVLKSIGKSLFHRDKPVEQLQVNICSSHSLIISLNDMFLKITVTTGYEVEVDVDLNLTTDDVESKHRGEDDKAPGHSQPESS